MRKRLSSLALLVTCFVMNAFAQFSGSGSGTESDPYKIFEAYELDQVRNFTNTEGVVFKLMSDIDLTQWIQNSNPSQGWLPIGVQSAPFKGKLYGNGKTITGFTINRLTDYVGLFGLIDGATIINLTITGDVVGGNFTGAFVGAGSGTLSELRYNGNVNGKRYAGGIAGNTANLGVATVNGDVTGSAYVGGIAGRAVDITMATMTGDVSGSYNVGGIAGRLNSIGKATVKGNITATSNYVGGVAGDSDGRISNSTVEGDVTSSGSYVGGLCGRSMGTDKYLENLFTGRVSGDSYVGGLSGLASSSYSYCFGYGTVTGKGDFVGGVVGKHSTSSTFSLDNCSFFGDISGVNYVGGVVGQSTYSFSISTQSVYIYESLLSHYRVYSRTSSQDYKEEIIDREYNGLINNCYSVGNVKGTGDYVGGVAGSVDGGAYAEKEKNTFNASHYLYDYSVQNTKYHYYLVNSNGETGTHLSSDNMQITYYKYYKYGLTISVKNCYFNGNVSGDKAVGGLVGNMTGGDIMYNYSNAIILGTQNVGGIVGTLQGFTNNTQTPNTFPVVLKSNMAINPSITASSALGRIYGLKGSDVTVGVNGNAAEDNNALLNTKVLLGGVGQVVDDNEQNGVNNGELFFKLKASYVGHGWDFNSNWTNLDTESFPYKTWQAAPPTFTSDLTSGDTSISGKSYSGGTVYIQIGNGPETSVTCTGNNWTLQNVGSLKSGETVRVYTKVSGLEHSYRTMTTVGFPGSGTQADPWRVYTAEDLQGVYKSGYYKQMNDINLTSWITANSPSKGWLSVGYTGSDPIVYDGDNHKITGLWTNTTEDYTGLFSNLPYATIRNLTVEASDKQVKGGFYTGILAGKIINGTLENVIVKGTAVSSVADVSNIFLGGVAGLMGGMTVNNVTFEGNVNTSSSATYHVYIGGIAGRASSSGFTGCVVNNANIKNTVENSASDLWMGLLVGYGSGSMVSDCIVKGVISAKSSAKVGGLAGGLSNPVTKCKSDVAITVSGENSSAGGLLGQCTSSSVSLCFSTGSVKVTGADSNVGGLIGAMGNCTLENCYSSAVTEGTMYTAGLVGKNLGKISKCYASGNVTSKYNGAGLVTLNSGSEATVTNCVALNKMVNVSDQSSWSTRVIGNYNDGAPEPDESNYAWNGMLVSVNGVPKTVSDNILQGQSLSDSQIKMQSSYEARSWDFNEIWGISEGQGYPYLQVFAVQPALALGDLNGDGSVSITDVVLIIDVIAGTITNADQVAAADVNNDGSVSITDCVAAVDLIAAQQTSAARMTRASSEPTTNDFISAYLQDGDLVVNLNNSKRYTAFQMVANLPKGMTLGKAAMDENRGYNHQVMVRDLGNGQYLIAGFSMDNDELADNSGRLLSITANGQSAGDIVISNVEFATVDAQAWRLASVVVSKTPTGIIEVLNHDSQTQIFFDLQGRRVEKPAKGLYIINGKKVNLK